MTPAVPISSEEPPKTLLDVVAEHSIRAVSPDFQVLVQALLEEYKTAADAVILYGSCLRSGALDEGIGDLYVLVNDYRAAYAKRYLSTLNAWLAPNVFYLEVPHAGRLLRAKYAVISTPDFEKGARYWFHSYIWARFAQPSRLLYARDEASRQRVYRALAWSVTSFLAAGGKTLENAVFTVDDIWIRCLMLSYAAELRPESETRARHLAEHNHADFAQLMHAASPALSAIFVRQLDSETYLCRNHTRTRRLAVWHWRLRRWQGLMLSILRLSKATLTFRDSLEYAAWKIERHTGTRIEITPRARRFPIIWGLKALWHLLRRSASR
ncbi:MAG: hypothetical protein R3E36_12460 [Nitrosomonas sp.]|nr:hypothetical protein [Nitrosomonas sp.]